MIFAGITRKKSHSQKSNHAFAFREIHAQGTVETFNQCPLVNPSKETGKSRLLPP